MKLDDVKGLHQRQLDRNGYIQTLEEWQQLLIPMHNSLVNRAKTVPFDWLPITYSELGEQIGLPFIPGYDWWPLEMACLLGACARFEYIHDRPMLTVIVVNESTKQPGQGFWGIDGIPSRLRRNSRAEDELKGIGRDEEREEFWVQEMRKVNDFWKNPDLKSSCKHNE